MSVAAKISNRCTCKKCGQRCDKCECARPVRVYGSSDSVRKGEHKRALSPVRQAYQTQRKREIVASGGCVDCGKPRNRKGSARCESCLASHAARHWRRKQITAILEHQENRKDPRVRACVRQWVTANEPELRALAAAERPAKVSAAAAARDKWRERLETVLMERPGLSRSERRELSVQLQAAAEFRRSLAR